MKQRIITGVILGVAALLAILFLPTMGFSLLLFLVAMIGLNEWSNLLKLESIAKIVYLAVGGFTLLLITVVLLMGAKNTVTLNGISLFSFVRGNVLLYGLLSITALFWLMMPFVLSIHARKPLAFLVNREFLFGASILTLAALIITLTTFQQVLPLLLYLILLVIIADSSAYFVGRKLGKRKLAPGAMGGLVIGILFSLGAILYFNSDNIQLFGARDDSLILYLNFLSLSALVVIVSISGDLFESVVKRHAGMKDSGSILPGHGGVLDRIDALTAAAPLFFIGLSFI